MESPAIQFAVILVVSTVAGCVNTMVGGGSYLTLPLLVLLGTSPVVANATNRFAICFQTVAATVSLRRQGVARWRDALPSALAALIGGVPGAMLADRMDPDHYRSAMGVILALSVLLMFLPRKDAKEGAPARLRWGLPAAFVFGVYGGFLGAGVGVMILLVMTPLMGIGLVRMVAVKILMVLAMSASGTIVFILDGTVDWKLVWPLMIGNTIGGVVGAKLTVLGGERWLRPLVAGIAVLLAIAMIFFSPFG